MNIVDMKWVLPVALLLLIAPAFSVEETGYRECTSILVGKGATVDGSVIHGYSADGAKYCYLEYMPAAEHSPGETFSVYTFDGSKIGEIPQLERTCAVWTSMDGAETPLSSGGINEFQVSIAETTIDENGALFCDRAMINYPNLMLLTLQRSRSAREAVDVMAGLVEEYGFYMEWGCGECITISDPTEAWVFEVFGPGSEWRFDSSNPGAVWVAREIEDDEIFVSANRARIGEIIEGVNRSSNVFSLAEDLGLWD